MASKVLIAGAGVAGLEAALALRELAAELVDVELVSPETDFVYRPLSVAEPFSAGEARRFPLHRLAEAAGASLIRAAVRSVDPERRMVVTSDGTALRYDALLVALGARPVASIPGASRSEGPETRRRSPRSSTRPRRARSSGSSSRCRPGRRGPCRSTSSRS